MARGDGRGATAFYTRAVQLARQMGQVSPDLVEPLQRAVSVIHTQTAAYEAHLQSRLNAAGFNPDQSSARFSLSLDLMAGRKRLFFQEPRFYLFPGLPQIEYADRESLPWLDAVERDASLIRAELQALLAEPELFRPYVESREDRPNGDQAGMLDNPDWSAIFLWKDGVEQSGIAARCPATLKALAAVPLCRIPGRTPSILFSKLSAGARIPPHNGVINTRLICHLPLITPPGCRLRVGNTVREWRDGVAWAFDDTIEHEARNDSDHDRIILIFDVWKDEITPEERGLITAMFGAIDAYAPSQAWGV
ncbi:hypothetical protein GGR13_002532 [Brevundimonas variabilis]|uniref:Aspartyl/asparaginy/proline hydroxylase domain-containing protein n=2 Tax=Brevundimonas variabilis TaxID=74312 RepID=A0A7W9CJP2_9CAUL|nr:hypothetical protein [Brevundimonas variabilis]